MQNQKFKQQLSTNLKNNNSHVNAISNMPNKHTYKMWLIISSFIVLIGMLISYAHAEENLYLKNYKAQNVYHLVSMQANPDTKMYVSNHKDEDNISMLEDGYDMMGSSGFEAGNVPAELALQHAKSIKADVVLVYTKYGSAKSASSKMEMIKQAVKSGKELTEKDMADDAAVYKYYASYWAKMPRPTLGVHIIKLIPQTSTEEVTDNNSGKGLRVLAVIKESPAFQAGLLRGDQLIAINDQILENPEDLTGYVSKRHGETINLRYLRDNQEYSKQVKLN
jgi:hypothetical protein